MQGRDRHLPCCHCMEIGPGPCILCVTRRSDPVDQVPARIARLDDLLGMMTLAKAGRDPRTDLLIGPVGDIDVEQNRPRRRVGIVDKALNHLSRHSGCAVEMLMPPVTE